jgi:hypothetical protein
VEIAGWLFREPGLLMPRVSEESRERNRVAQKIRNQKSNPNRSRSFGRLDSDIASMRRRPFIGWDGEGYREFVCGESIDIRHCYMLFGASTGDKIIGRDLGTAECLDLMLDVERENPDAIHVGFATEYDVNMILRDLRFTHLTILKIVGECVWKGYRIKHTPGKLFRVSKGGVSVTLFNVFGFFHSSYIRAIEKYEVGSSDERSFIKSGKDRRSQFTFSEMKAVLAYWNQEIALLPPLMDKLREACYSAGFFITEWHGPGALASYALKQNNSREMMASESSVPSPVKMARALAYAGGRFQAWRCGFLLAPIYTADINSAYAYAASQCPDLHNGEWHRVPVEHGTVPSIARFGLYKIRFDAGGLETVRRIRDWGIPMPLFHRGNGKLTWPTQTTGWYWSPEAALVHGTRHAVFLEAWVFEDDGTRPFAWIADAFARRLDLQAKKHPAEKAYKWMLAAMYGQWAQRVGWDKKRKKPPRSHQLEWAGFITSMCRAMVYRAASDVAKRGGLVSIDTDGVTSTVPFREEKLPNGVGEQLGAWKLEQFTGMLYWQNGIYWLRGEDGKWEEPKTRGVPRGQLSFDAALRTRFESSDFSDPQKSAIRVQRQRFVGYGQALNGQYDSWRRWIPSPSEVLFGGSGKGMHVPAFCAKCKVCSSIPLHTITHFPPDTIESEPHKLPWLGADIEAETNVDEYIWEEDA